MLKTISTPHSPPAASKIPPQAQSCPRSFREKVCCGETGFSEKNTAVDESAATIKSMYTGDASIGVSLLTPGSAERLGGTWYLSLDGEASEPIDAGATVGEVLAAVQNLTDAGNVSVSNSTEGEGFNGERSWVITFFDWNDPNRTAVPPVVFIDDQDLVGTGAAAHLETAAGASITTDVDGELQLSQLCAKEVTTVTSLVASGEIDECIVVAAWQGGTTYAVPAFSFDANATSVETALAGVDGVALGEVWVTRQADPSASGGGVWDLTFIANSAGRTPELQCAADADVSQVSSSTCEPIGGSFALAFEGSVTQDIAFDAPALEVRLELTKACLQYRIWTKRGMGSFSLRTCIFTETDRNRRTYVWDPSCPQR